MPSVGMAVGRYGQNASSGVAASTHGIVRQISTYSLDACLVGVAGGVARSAVVDVRRQINTEAVAVDVIGGATQFNNTRSSNALLVGMAAVIARSAVVDVRVQINTEAVAVNLVGSAIQKSNTYSSSIALLVGMAARVTCAAGEGRQRQHKGDQQGTHTDWL